MRTAKLRRFITAMATKVSPVEQRKRNETARLVSFAGMFLCGLGFAAVEFVLNDWQLMAAYLCCAALSGACIALDVKRLVPTVVHVLCTAAIVVLEALFTVSGFFGGTGLCFSFVIPLLLSTLCGMRWAVLSGALLLALSLLVTTGQIECGFQQAVSSSFCTWFPIVYVLAFAFSLPAMAQGHKRLVEAAEFEARLVLVAKNERLRASATTTQAISCFSNAVDARDTYTREHSYRVAEYSKMLAKALGWDDERIDQVYVAALMHDIGKIGIPDGVVNKHGGLSDEEYELMKQHPVIGGEILKDMTLMPYASVGALYHHERFDGTGYPYGLQGTQIPEEARLISITDAFDSMNSDRIYRKKRDPRRIYDELCKGKGSQFDPDMLEMFLPIALHILELD